MTMDSDLPCLLIYKGREMIEYEKTKENGSESVVVR